MSYLLATLVAAVLLSSEGLGKTVTGLFKTEVARQENGQFITKFMYQGDNGLLVCRLDSSALATERESRLLLYQGYEWTWTTSAIPRLGQSPLHQWDQHSLIQSDF
ncbi:integral membrane protein GPR180 [Lates japonicus]|uniref:Integral membrane protein GPR180 n=1 Tax=Lates japonicus TaxID=270547 RepID=A0AAD3NDR8_LATJO|nr:integral membrane protein GPR180 [Lates japonicus]